MSLAHVDIAITLHFPHIVQLCPKHVPNVSVGLRHGDRQHGGHGPAEGGGALQGARGHAEEAPPPEREEAQQSHPAGPLHR